MLQEEAAEPRASKERIELKGNTLRTYIYLLRFTAHPVGVRELQRALGFSSPNLAQYHLEKLVEMGLAKSDNGEYHLVKEAHVDVLQQFVKLGSFIFPRFVIYATMFTILLAYFGAQLSSLNIYSLWALIFGFSATIISWIEAIRASKLLP